MEDNKQRQAEKKVNKNALRTAIIISWVVLAVCFIIKLFGGKYFEIATSNSTFSKVCAFVDNHLWLQDIIAFFTSLLATILVNLAVLQRKWFTVKQLLIVLVFDIFAFVFVILGDFFDSLAMDIVGFIASLLPVCICPMILSKKPVRSIIALLLYIAFQIVSMIVKGLSITGNSPDNTLVALIFTIDFYIMLILYYLHANWHIGKTTNKITEKGDK